VVDTAQQLARDLVFDLRLAIRGLLRDRAFSLTAIATLAVSLALNVTVFTVMDAMLFRGLPLAKQSDRLLYLAMRKPMDLACCPGPIRFADFEAWRTQSRAFEGLAFGRNGEPITFREGAGRAIDMTVSRRSANTFGLLGVQPILGRDFAASDEAPGAPPVVILSHQFWERRFGKRLDIVGATVHINGAPATIIGVMPERFALVYEQDLWMPLAITPGLEGGVIGRLRDDATIEQARAELDAITRGLQAADTATVRGVPSVSSYSQAHVAPDAPMIYRSLWAGAWFVLLIACANLANLTLVRTVGRGREFSTRIALGAGQWRLIRQTLIESVALTSVATALAWSLTSWSVRTWAEATASRYLALDYTLNSSTVIYLCAIAATSAILIAMLPIARVRQLGAHGALKGDARGVTQGPRNRRLTAALVSVQMALAMVLLLGAGVLVRSFEKIVGAETGVRHPEQIVTGALFLPSDTYPTRDARLAFLDRLDTQLRTVAGVEQVSMANTIPTRVVNRRAIEIEGRPSAIEGGEFAQVMTAGPNYFDVMGVSAGSGRDFTNHDDAGKPLVVQVNHSFAQAFWPNGNALGARLRMIDRNAPGPWRIVVGIVPNIMQGDATRQDFKPVIYVPFRQQLSIRLFVFARTNAPAHQGIQAVRSEVMKIDRDVIAEDFSTLEARFAFDRDFMDLEHADLAKHAAIAPVFAVIALLLSAIGLIAVIAHSVSQRTKEIGVRMAIGAAAGDIARMIVREGMRPVAIGLVVGLPAAAGANRLLESQLVGVTPYDPLTMAAATLILIGVALVGCRIPARRAMRVDPVVALRHE
jgi:putative ABC transport system permease protein